MFIDIEKDKAIAIAQTKWWEKYSSEVIFLVQLQINQLICPFELFQRSAEKILKRPVWTHEFVKPELLLKEYNKEIVTPTPEEVINKLPQDKTILICTY